MGTVRAVSSRPLWKLTRYSTGKRVSVRPSARSSAAADRLYAVRTRWSARRIIGDSLDDLPGNPGPLLPAA